MEINIENNSVNLEFGTSSIDLKSGTQTIYEKDHKNLDNLDFENSGHTGFQKAGDYALKSDIPDVSNFITKDVANLSNYYNKDSIDEMIGDIESLLSEV